MSQQEGTGIRFDRRFSYTIGIFLPAGRLSEVPIRGRYSALVVLWTPQERTALEHWRRSTSTPMGLVRRAQMLLSGADAPRFIQAARQAGLTAKHARKWVQRFLIDRLDGLYDKPGRGRNPVFSPQVALHAVKIACERPDTCGRSVSLWTASRSPANSWPRPAPPRSVPSVCAGGSLRTGSSPGASRCGCRRRCLATPPLPPRCGGSPICIRVRSCPGNGSSARMSIPVCSRAPAWLRRGPVVRDSRPRASRSIDAAAPSTCWRPWIPKRPRLERDRPRQASGRVYCAAATN